MLPCQFCDGTGQIEVQTDSASGEFIALPCEHCGGTGGREADGGDFQEDGDY